MKTQFDDPLELSSDGRRIFATGPIEWSPEDQGHRCQVNVTITQGAVSVPGSTGSYGTNDDTWECHVDAPDGAAWQVAPVRCHGEVAMSDPPPADQWPDQTVALQLQTAATPA